MQFKPVHITSYKQSLELYKLLQREFPEIQYKTMLYWAVPRQFDFDTQKMTVYDPVLINSSEPQFYIKDENNLVYCAYTFTELIELADLLPCGKKIRSEILRRITLKTLLGHLVETIIECCSKKEKFEIKQLINNGGVVVPSPRPRSTAVFL